MVQLPSWVVARQACILAEPITLLDKAQEPRKGFHGHLNLFLKRFQHREPNLREVERWTHLLSYPELVAGLAVSLYQTWRMPYIAMTVPPFLYICSYLLFQFLVGFPLHYLGLCIGSLSKNGAVNCWSQLPAGKGLMFSFTLMALLNAMNMIVWLAIGLGMFVASFRPSPPWMDCLPNATVGCAARHSASMDGLETPSESYIHDHILKLNRLSSGDGLYPMNLYFVYLLALAWALVWAVLYYGIYSLSKITLTTLIMNICCWLVFLVGAMKLHKASDGFGELFSPEAKKLKWLRNDPTQPSELDAILAALKQCLMECFLATGVVVFLGKHARRFDPVRPASILYYIFSTLTSLVCLLICVSVLASIGGDFPKKKARLYQGPTLPIALYAELTARLHGVHFWSVCLFTAFCFSAVYTLGLLMLVVIKSFQQFRLDLFKRKTRYLAAAFCFILFCVTSLLYAMPSGMYVVAALDHFVCTKPAILLSALTCIVVCYIHGTAQLVRNLRVVKNEIVPPFFPAIWHFIPILLIIFAVLDLLVKPPSVYKRQISWIAQLFLNIASYAIVLPVLLYIIPFLLLVIRTKSEERAEKRALHSRIREDLAKREQEQRREMLQRAQAKDRQRRAGADDVSSDRCSSQVYTHGRWFMSHPSTKTIMK